MWSDEQSSGQLIKHLLFLIVGIAQQSAANWILRDIPGAFSYD